MSETDLYGKIIGAHSHAYTRLFRTNAAVAWQGTVIERTPTRLVLANPRAIHMGAPGMSDLIGWSPLVVGDTHVAVYTAIEVKGRLTRTTAEQTAFIEIVRRSGGRAGIARSVDDAGAIVRGEV